ncbi:hypothetical protein L596_016301 [Steinernema carpocapsae]|uniref:Uncharacterized protein n=1 Tax=Steinernema carpocapsae TaxID=34508 RepID=A0A4U5NHK8_STECR|nr:hypothetical protein L596_016301 [Steinernema carpocapsae]
MQGLQLPPASSMDCTTTPSNGRLDSSAADAAAFGRESSSSGSSSASSSTSPNSSQHTIHVFFSASPWERRLQLPPAPSASKWPGGDAICLVLNTGLSDLQSVCLSLELDSFGVVVFRRPVVFLRSLLALTMNPSSSRSTSTAYYDTTSPLQTMMDNVDLDDLQVSTSSNQTTMADSSEVEASKSLNAALHKDVVDRWIEVHFAACQVRSYIPPVFNIHTRAMSEKGHHHHKHPNARRSRNASCSFARSRAEFGHYGICAIDIERPNILKLKKTTCMKRNPPAMGASSRLSRDRRRSTPAFAALGGYNPQSSGYLELEPIPEATEEDEHKDSGVASASGSGEAMADGIWPAIADPNLKNEETISSMKPFESNESLETNLNPERLCDKLCEEMAELPLSDQPSPESLVTQCFAHLAVNDPSNRRIVKL